MLGILFVVVFSITNTGDADSLTPRVLQQLRNGLKWTKPPGKVKLGGVCAPRTLQAQTCSPGQYTWQAQMVEKLAISFNPFSPIPWQCRLVTALRA
jgi:hypothetical protein